jgi:hypothetical protein
MTGARSGILGVVGGKNNCRLTTDAYFHRGNAYDRTGQHVKAAADISEYLRLKRNNAEESE